MGNTLYVCMQIEYKTKKLKKVLTDPVLIQKNFGDNAKKVAQRMQEMRDAPNLAVLISIPAARCHSLSGNRQNEYAVSISPNHRLIFEIANDPVPGNNDGSVNTLLVTIIRILESTDYH
ncbi:MAG: type II toxin-antitoxin system RelE/ParE family toxin [Bacteroidota bacterium]